MPGIWRRICRRPCALLKRKVKPGKPFVIKPDLCRSCKACMRIGCPAIRMTEQGAVIDDTLCVGCGLCKPLCAFGAIAE